jgi:hypothetical protein
MGSHAFITNARQAWHSFRLWWGSWPEGKKGPLPVQSGRSEAREKQKPAAKSSGSRLKKTDLRDVMSKMSAALDDLHGVRKPLNSLAGTAATDYEAILGTVGPIVLMDYGKESFYEEGWATETANDFASSAPPESGAVWMGGGSDEDTLYPKCCAFIRVPQLSPNVEVCRKGEIPYISALLYTDGGEMFGRYWREFPIAYNLKTGSARALRVRRPAKGNVVAGGGRGMNSGLGHVCGVGRGALWSYCEPTIDEPREKSGCMAFLFAMNAWASRDTGWLVVASKKRRKIVFRVPEADTPRWFKDRITVVTSGGRKRPIIHQVVAHARKTKKGVTYVRPHIRGERKFVWDGAKISVVVPGFHTPTSDAWTKVALGGEGASSAKHFARIRDALDAA